jgi:hypothetical protein
VLLFQLLLIFITNSVIGLGASQKNTFLLKKSSILKYYDGYVLKVPYFLYEDCDYIYNNTRGLLIDYILVDNVGLIPETDLSASEASFGIDFKLFGKKYLNVYLNESNGKLYFHQLSGGGFLDNGCIYRFNKYFRKIEMQYHILININHKKKRIGPFKLLII